MGYARLRFGTAITVIAGGVLLGIGAFVFSPSTERWLGLGVGAGLIGVTVPAFATSGRGAVQRVLDVLLIPICAWALISARTIALPSHGASDSLVKWLGLSAGAGIFAVGVIALLAHEVGVESDLRWALAELTSPRGDVGSEAASVAHPAESEPEASEPEPEPEASEPEREPTTPEPEPESTVLASASEAKESDREAEPTMPEPESEPEREAIAAPSGPSNANGNGHHLPDRTPASRREMWLTPIAEDASPSAPAGGEPQA